MENKNERKECPHEAATSGTQIINHNYYNSDARNLQLTEDKIALVKIRTICEMADKFGGYSSDKSIAFDLIKDIISDPFSALEAIGEEKGSTNDGV